MEMRSQLREKENRGQKLTFILSNNGRREVYHILSVNLTTADSLLSWG